MSRHGKDGFLKDEFSQHFLHVFCLCGTRFIGSNDRPVLLPPLVYFNSCILTYLQLALVLKLVLAAYPRVVDTIEPQ